jgi:hypothetical protein
MASRVMTTQSGFAGVAEAPIEMSSTIRWGVFALLFFSSASIQAQARGGQGDGQRIIIYSNALRPLPFVLNFSSAPRPRTAQQLIISIRTSLPEGTKSKIIHYYSENWSSLEHAEYDFLYLPEIINMVAQHWRLWNDSQLISAIRCVGKDFVQQIGLQIAFDELNERREANIPLELSERAKGLTEAYFISKRLFEVCDDVAARKHSR